MLNLQSNKLMPDIGDGEAIIMATMDMATMTETGGPDSLRIMVRRE